MVNIVVGLVNCSAGWEILLQQEGISFEHVSSAFNPDNFSVLIVGNEPAPSGLFHIKSFLKSGGSILFSSKAFSEVSGIECNKVPVRSLVSKRHELFEDIGLVDIFTECLVHPDANELHSLDGIKTVYAGKYLGGTCVVLPIDAGELILDERIAKKSFYSEEKRLPFERVSLVSKSGIRRLAARSLEYLHHQRGLPYVHTWYYPRAVDSTFLFRIDTDYSDRQGIERLYELSGKYNIPYTWFVDTKSQESFIDVFAKMQRHEIGIHCYDHVRFEDAETCLNNIRKARDILREAGIKEFGFAAPYGIWSNEVAKAIRSMKLEYTSEFSYDYDNLPSTPLIQGERQILQVPIHPVSIGTLRRLGYTDEMMVEYFRRVITEKIGLREPVILFHHPNDGHENVLHVVFNLLRDNNIPATTFHEYAQWWKVRLAARFHVSFGKNTLNIQSDRMENEIWLHITFPSGKEVFTTETGNISVAGMTLGQMPPKYFFPENISKIRKFNPWISIIKVQDETIGKLKKFRAGRKHLQASPKNSASPAPITRSRKRRK